MSSGKSVCGGGSMPIQVGDWVRILAERTIREKLDGWETPNGLPVVDSMLRHCQLESRVVHVDTDSGNFKLAFNPQWLWDEHLVKKIPTPKCSCGEDAVARCSCGNYVCENCVEACDACNEPRCPNCMTECSACDHRVCYDCTRTCEQCGDEICCLCRYNCSSCGDTVCRDCIRGDYCIGCTEECIICGEACLRRNMRETADGYICLSCAPTDKLNVNSYSYIPRWKYTDKPWDCVIHYGIELETNFNPAHDVLSPISETAKDLNYIWKSDSSIGQGAEMVTHPYSWQSLKEIRWIDILPKMAERCDSEKSGRCGLHVHVSAEAFSTRLEYRKARWFMSTNADKIIFLSGRSFKQHLQWCKIPARGEWGTERCALHKSPKGTYEFRLFRGTLDYERFMGYLEFVEHLIAYVKVHGIAHVTREESWGSFLAYAKQRGRKYLVKLADKIPSNLSWDMIQTLPEEWRY